MHDQPPLLEMRGITKRFGAVTANAVIDLTLSAGEIVGLLGENGAGKTTLMNILFGAYDADEGTIRIDDRPAVIRSSADALALGVGMVHQHYHLVPSHTVLENLMVGQSVAVAAPLRPDDPGPDGRIYSRYGLHPRPVGALPETSPSASSSGWKSSRH
jgi:ABC-type uncharacterized transport system ATPase subunit